MAITANKLLGKKEKGGALAVRPTTSLVSYKGIDLSDIQKSESDSSEKTLFSIQKKIILVDDLLKGTFAEKKKRQKDEKTEKENEKRKKTESKIEDDATDSDDKEENKLKMPRISFLDGIKQFISNILLGWLAFKLIKHLPTITKFLKPIAAIAGFFIKFGGFLLSGLVTFIDWGYKALNATQEWIGDKFGDGAAQKFESFMGNLTKMFNGIIILGMGIAKMAMMGKKPKGPKGPKGSKQPKSKLRKSFEKRWKKSKPGKFVRNQKAKTLKLKRKLNQSKKNFKKNLSKSFKKSSPGKFLRNQKAKGIKLKRSGSKITKNLSKSLNKTKSKLSKNLSKSLSKTKTSLSKSAGKVGKTISKSAGKVGKTIGKSVGKVASKGATKLGGVLGKHASKIGKGMKGVLPNMKSMAKVFKKVAKGIKIPVIGPLIVAGISILSGEGIGRAAFKGIGAALGGILGNLIPIPVVGMLIGEGIGMFVGDFLYEGFLGKGFGAAASKLGETLKGMVTGAGKIGKAMMDWIFGGGLLSLLKSVGGGLMRFVKYLFLGGLLMDIIKGAAGAAKMLGQFIFGGGLFKLLTFSATLPFKFGKWIFFDAIPWVLEKLGGAAMLLKEWMQDGMGRFVHNFPVFNLPLMKFKILGIGIDINWMLGKAFGGLPWFQQWINGEGQLMHFPDFSMFIPGLGLPFLIGHTGKSLFPGSFFENWPSGISSGVNAITKAFGYKINEAKERTKIEKERIEKEKENNKEELKGNGENILPLDVNSVKKKTDDVSMSASYEDDSGEIIVVEKGSQEEGDPETKSKETLTPIAVGAGGGSDEMGDRLYKGG